MNCLDKADARLFHATIRILMDYSNRLFHIDDKADFLHDDRIDPGCSKKVVDKIWEIPALIDDILRTRDLSEEQRSLLSGWKNCVPGTFVIERHLKDGSIFIGSDDKVYQVVGITDPIKDMFERFPMPAIVQTTLLPFRDVIITDGLFSHIPVMIGPGIHSGLKESYMNAKQNQQIIRQLPEKKQEAAALNKKGKNPANLYRLKVYPNGNGRSVYRIIEICGNATLEKLCAVIMNAFDFIHEHAFEFIIDGCDAYQSDPDYGELSAKVRLDKLGLVPRQKFYLHYDFGDDWMFTIHVESISESPQIKPRVIKSLGSIEQYPDEY